MTDRSRLRLPAPVQAAAQDYADAWGLTLTQAVAHLVMVGLGSRSAQPGHPVPRSAQPVPGVVPASAQPGPPPGLAECPASAQVGPSRDLSGPHSTVSTRNSTAVLQYSSTGWIDPVEDPRALLERFDRLQSPSGALAEMAGRIRKHGGQFRSAKQARHFAGLLATAEEAERPRPAELDPESARVAQLMRERRAQ